MKHDYKNKIEMKNAFMFEKMNLISKHSEEYNEEFSCVAKEWIEAINESRRKENKEYLHQLVLIDENIAKIKKDLDNTECKHPFYLKNELQDTMALKAYYTERIKCIIPENDLDACFGETI